MIHVRGVDAPAREDAERDRTIEARQAEGASDAEVVVVDGVEVELADLALAEAGEEADPVAMAGEADRLGGEGGDADGADHPVGAEAAGFLADAGAVACDRVGHVAEPPRVRGCQDGRLHQILPAGTFVRLSVIMI